MPTKAPETKKMSLTRSLLDGDDRSPHRETLLRELARAIFLAIFFFTEKWQRASEGNGGHNESQLSKYLH